MASSPSVSFCGPSGEQMVRRALLAVRSALFRTDVWSVGRGQSRDHHHIRPGVDDDALLATLPQLEADLAGAKIERHAAEFLEQISAEQQCRLIGQTEHL